MPAKSKKQANFMRLCINAPEKARRPCPMPSQARRVLGIGERGPRKGAGKKK